MPASGILLVSLDKTWSASLSHALTAHGGFRVIGTSSSLMDAYTRVEETQPNLVILAYEFTRLPEFEMVLALFAALGTRWLAVSDIQRQENTLKPQFTKRSSGIFMLDVSDSLFDVMQMIISMTALPNARKNIREVSPVVQTSFLEKMVLIGASTGGVDALSAILSEYPSNCPPTLVVQHTGQSFGPGLVQLLDRRCAAHVVPADDGMQLSPGTVCIAAGDRRHLQIASASPVRTRMLPGAPVSGHLPSVDALFRSAVPFADKVVGVLLTGMGSDGAQGLLELRRAGARTFAQDEATSVVYGMPRIAWEIGAAEARLPLKAISAQILRACQGDRSEKQRVI